MIVSTYAIPGEQRAPRGSGERAVSVLSRLTKAVRVINVDGSVSCEAVGLSGAWSLNGHGGTTAANFLGTTGSKPLVLKTPALLSAHAPMTTHGLLLFPLHRRADRRARLIIRTAISVRALRRSQGPFRDATAHRVTR